MEFIAQTASDATTSSSIAVARGPLASLAPRLTAAAAAADQAKSSVGLLTVSGLLEAESAESSPGVSPDRRSISPLVCDVTENASASELSLGHLGQSSPAALRHVPCGAFRVAVVNAVDLQPPVPEGTPGAGAAQQQQQQQLSVSQFTALPKYAAVHLLTDAAAATAAPAGNGNSNGAAIPAEKRLRWAHTAARTGRNPEWDASAGSVIVPLPQEYTGTATLEVAVYGKLNALEETYSDLFLGHGFVKLDAYATETLTFRVFLGRGDAGRSTHAHGAEQHHGRSSYVVIKVTPLRCAAAVLPDEFTRDAQHPINKTHPSLRAAVSSSSSASSASSSSLSMVQHHKLRRRVVTSVVHTEEHSYLKSGFALEVTVKEAKDLNPHDGLHMGELFVSLRLGGLSFRTNVVEGASATTEATTEGEGKLAQWNETFLVHLPALGPSVMDVAFYQAGTNRPIGAGAVDLLALPWERADTIECQVRLRLRGQLAGVLLVALKQVPAGCVLKWREILTERVRIEESWSSFVAELYAEEAHQRRCLFSAWETVCRMHLWNREESFWAASVHEYRSWIEWVRVQTTLRCTLSVTVVEASGLSSAGRTRVSVFLGQHSSGQTALIRGTNCPRWREEFQLHAPGCLYHGSKVLALPLRVEVWDVDQEARSGAAEGCLGVAEVPLVELCHREAYDLVLHLATGGYVCVALCPLDFGLPSEDPRLVVRVLRATDLPLRGGAQPKPAVAARLGYDDAAATAAAAADADTRAATRTANPQSTDVTWKADDAAEASALEGWAITTAQTHGTNPVWNEEFVLPVRRPADGAAEFVLPSRLELKVFDTEGGARDLMGSIAMQLQGLVRNQPYAYRLWLTVTTSGTVEQNSCVVVELCAKGFGAIQLPAGAMGGGGGANPQATATVVATATHHQQHQVQQQQQQQTVTTTTTTTTGRPSQ